MTDNSVIADQRLSLPLTPAPNGDDAQSEWHGWTLLDAPEPITPQGDYADAQQSTVDLPEVALTHPTESAELLAPAGGPEAAFAAFHYGADAIYLGLKKFSARAEAENFSLDEVDEITAYAHSLTPRRRVFVTINTLIRQDELAELIADVAGLADIGVDAIILQDLGVYRLLRDHFPELELHASTQLAVHNRAGAEVLKQLGFQRVVLARELTFEEVRDITGAAGVETEVFIHGALCYSYSGLCLFSSQTMGRSGNRGKCSYSCRDNFEVTGAPLTLRDGQPVRRDPGQGFPFSMKDLALPDHIPSLRAAGVSCFKIEGRKKSPLYVATTTDYYRKLIDGQLTPEDRPQHEADMQTVFSRPWTHLFVQSHKDKEVADRDTVGHRGTVIGKVEDIRDARLRFRASRALERHDGLQIDLPTLGKPFGFAVEHLWLVKQGRRETREEVFEAPAGAIVEVELPENHPALPKGALVYCSSSQAVKQRYRHEKPKPGQFRGRRALEIDVRLSKDALIVTGRCGKHDTINVCSRSLAGPFAPSKDPAAMDRVMRETFAKLGESCFELASFTFRNDAQGFVPVSKLNQLRRDLIADMESKLRLQRDQRTETLQAASAPRLAQQATHPFQWSLKVDRIAFLDAFDEPDFAEVEEIVIDIARDHPALLLDKLDGLAARLGRERLRLALPPLSRAWEEKGIRQKIRHLLPAGWNRWEAGNLSAWSYLGINPRRPNPNFDLATDWSIYVLNRLAAQELLDMGVRRFALSPEDGRDNLRSLLAEFGEHAVLIVHQDTPLFLAESCAYANLIGGCPGKANCRFESMEMVSSHGERVTALDYHCRTIVLNQGPFCLSPRLRELAKMGASHLRADFVYRPYEPAVVRDHWRLIRAGKVVTGGHAANFERGVL